MKKCLLVFLLIFSPVLSVSAAESYTNAYDAIALFTRVLEEVQRGYVDAGEAGYDRLIRHALTGMLQNLDPYSQFLDEEEFKELKDDTSGHFGGVGLVISLKDGVLTVIAPMEDTPAFRAGILSGDLIVEIDGEETHSMGLAAAVRKMRGQPGTDVALKTIRPSTRETKEHVIVREDIQVRSVKDARLMEDKIGYVRITQFSEPTAEDLKSELLNLKNDGMRALVIDLRGNPGGLLSSASAVAELFLPRGSLIVYTKGRDEKSEGQRFLSRSRGRFSDIPLAVLVNGGSASASEIVAGALRDHQRAVLVGEKTFGKGSVQSILSIDDGSALKLTTARYYTPSGQMIHDKGINPDIPVEMDPELFFQIRLKQSGLDSVINGETSEDRTLQDHQLEKAVGVLQGVLFFQGK